MDKMKKISVVTACYNEEANVLEIYQQIKEVFKKLPGYLYELIYIDNASEDKTAQIIKEIIKEDDSVRLIQNARNFGYVRSPYYGILQAKGDAVIYLASDFQDPPTLIPQFIQKWEEGYKIAVGVKHQSNESSLMFSIRKMYYQFVGKIANIKLIKNFTGFGLYDQSVVEILRKMGDAYPYFRGLISEIGFDVAQIPFTQPARKRGISKSNFYMLYDVAMLGITSQSKVPLRIATMAGFGLSLMSFAIAVLFFILKILFWNSFSLGMAPVLMGIFFFFSVQLFFIGILGEYIGAIHTQVMNRPLIIERERINFNESHHDK